MLTYYYYNKEIWKFYQKHKGIILLGYIFLMHLYFFYYTQSILVEQINNENQLNEKFDEVLTLLNNNAVLNDNAFLNKEDVLIEPKKGWSWVELIENTITTYIKFFGLFTAISVLASVAKM